jgi:hypothetical protein
MKFYLCQTPLGPQLAGTQADAKALDKNFETVEWATDKDALMERFNDLFAQIAGIAAVAADEQAYPVTDLGDDNHVELVREPRKKAKVVEPDWQSAPEPGDCKRCVAMSAAARSIEGTMALTNIEHAIQYGDKPFLRKIDEMLETRAEELNA